MRTAPISRPLAVAAAAMFWAACLSLDRIGVGAAALPAVLAAELMPYGFGAALAHTILLLHRGGGVARSGVDAGGFLRCFLSGCLAFVALQVIVVAALVALHGGFAGVVEAGVPRWGLGVVGTAVKGTIGAALVVQFARD